MYTTQTYTYKTAAGVDIQADVHRMPGEEVRPAILWIHGGMLMIGSRKSIAPDQLRRYVEAGYAVVCVDYRLAPEVKLASIIEDLRDACSWLWASAPTLRIDLDRIAVIGHSAGGYLTLMTGCCIAQRPRALVSFYGYGDILGPWYSQPDPHYNTHPAVPEDEARSYVGQSVLTSTDFNDDISGQRWRFYLYCRQHGLWPQEVGGQDPVTDAEWFTAYCPVQNVSADYPPTLLLHGDDDSDVPVEQSILMAEALSEAGVEHELRVLPGQPHGFDGKWQEDSEVAAALDQVMRFLDQHLKN